MRSTIASRPPEADGEDTWVSVAGKRVAFATKGGPLVLDGVPDVAATEVSKVEFSDDGKRVAYHAQHGDRRFVVIDGRATSGVERFSQFAPKFLGGRVAYTAKHDGKWWVFVDGERAYGPFTMDAPGHGFVSSYLCARPGDGAVAYVGVTEAGMRVEAAGQPLSEWWKLVREPSFGSDGTLAFRALRDDAWWIVVGDRSFGPYEKSDTPARAGDGSLWWIAGKDADMAVYRDGEPVERHAAISALVVARDRGVRAIQIEQDRREAVYVDGVVRTSGHKNLLGLTLSPDGAHFAVVSDQGSKGDVIVDGAVSHAAVKSIHEHSLVLAGSRAAFHVNEPEYVQLGTTRGESFDALWSDLVPIANGVAYIAEAGGELFYEELT